MTSIYTHPPPPHPPSSSPRPQKHLTYGIDIFSTGNQSGKALEASWANVAAAGLTDAPVLHTASFTEALPLADGVFGVVASSLAVHNVRAEWRRKAVDMARVCLPGGWIVVLDLVGYVGGYAEVLRENEWTEVDRKWGGARVMFGAWPREVLSVRKPLGGSYGDGFGLSVARRGELSGYTCRGSLA